MHHDPRRSPLIIVVVAVGVAVGGVPVVGLVAAHAPLASPPPIAHRKCIGVVRAMY